jgi:uncharacterized protein YdbL (DUF1318 family)
MKRKLAVILAVIMLVVAIPTAGFASEVDGSNDLVDAGITPDSWLYGFDGFLKELHLFFTFNAADKAGLMHDISEERLAEAKEMIEKNKAKYGTVALLAYKSALERAIEAMDKAILEGKDITEAVEKFGGTLADRQKMIKWLLEQIPEEDREKLNVPLQDTIDDITVTIDVVDIDETDETDGQDNNEGTPDGEDPANTDENTDESGNTDENTEGTDNGDSTGTDETPGENETGTGDETSNEDGSSEEPEENDETGEIDDEDYINVCSLKKLLTVKILEEVIGEEAAKLYKNGTLNTRQVL